MIRFSILSFLSLWGVAASAQQVLIVNGGVFGSSNYANVSIYDVANNSYTTIDTIRVTSIQDVHIEGDTVAYVAAQDSIIKYDLRTRTRLAAAQFNAPSTVHLAAHGSHLFVGNWYAPWGHVGAYTNNFRIFDKNTLAYVDSIPQIVKGAKDFVFLNGKAYIAQNTNDGTTNYTDSLGYLSVVDLTTLQWLRNDTLSTQGYDVGRLLVWNDQVISINGVSNTISYLNTATLQKNTAASRIDLQPLGTAPTIYADDSSSFFMPFNDIIGSYDVNANAIAKDSIVLHGQQNYGVTGFAYAHDAVQGDFYLSKIFYTNQANNYGVIYDHTGDSIGTFPVGYSPEALAVFRLPALVGVAQTDAPSVQLSVYPNPVVNTLFINAQSNAPSAGDWRIVVYNAVGQQIDELPLAARTELNVSTYTSGLYWLQVIDKKQATVKKPMYHPFVKP